MSNQNPNQPNPYSAPTARSEYGAPRDPSKFNPWMVKAPAIALLIVSLLGLAVSTFNVFYALQAPTLDPNASEYMRQMQKSATGPVAVAIQSAFCILNIVILIGAVQMLRIKTWAFALVASILAIVDLAGFCCILGIPVGIWSIVILFQPKVKKAFEQNR